jgi:hypothetical protein
MPTASKIGVSGIFMLGGLVIVAGIVRLVFLVQAYTALSNPTDDVSCTTILCSCARGSMLTSKINRYLLASHLLDNCRAKCRGDLSMPSDYATFIPGL